MKPLKLILKNIGPYINQEIDFENLENMFLITGNTGAGKTFIFDSMTYALYGVLRGNREKIVESLKSRYVSDDEDASVDFIFEIGGNVYRCYRTVQREYINRNGKKSKKPQEIIFYKKIDDEFVPVCEKNSTTETDAAIRDLLGLSAAEFSQIVLLPQGQFSEFLKQNSKDRRITLQKIFPVMDYTRLMESVKAKADIIQNELKDKNAIILATEGDFDFSDAENKIKNLSDEIEAFAKEENSLNETKTELTGKITNIERDLEEAKKVESNVNQLDKLESEKETFDEIEKQISLAEEALVLSGPIFVKKDAEKRFCEDSQALQSAESAYKFIKDTFDSLNEKSSEMDLLKEKLQNDKKDLGVIQEKLKIQDDYKETIKLLETNESELEKAEEKFNKVENQFEEKSKEAENKNPDEELKTVNEKLISVSQKESDLTAVLEKAIKRDEMVNKKIELEDSIKAVSEELQESENKKTEVEAKIKELSDKIENCTSQNKAFALVDLLKPDCPCPVCGSKNHPSPATKPGDLSNEQELLDAKKETLVQLENNIRLNEQDLASKKSLLDNALETLKELINIEETETIKNQLEEVCADKNALAERKTKFEELKKDLKNLEESKNQLENNLRELKSERKLLEERKNQFEKTLGGDLESIIEKEKLLSKEIEKNTDAFETWEKAFNESKEEKISGEKNIKNCEENLSQSEMELKEAEKALEEGVKKSKFKTVEDAENAFIPKEELAEKKDAFKKYSDELELYRNLVKSAEKLKKVSEIEEELKAERIKISEIEDKITAVKLLLDEKKSEKDRYSTAWEKLQKMKEEMETLRRESEPLFKLHQDISGANPQKTTFDTWALGMYFEQVVEFASKRFEQISGGRFRFKLKNLDDEKKGNGFKGLDLMVWDQNTDEYADPSSLSGGETFEASISLALAITDVVQSSKGGISLDSLFIDEGFGTLDAEALDKAISIFTELGESKMIGIISHVEGLRNVITSELKVIKTNRGSTVEIV